MTAFRRSRKCTTRRSRPRSFWARRNSEWRDEDGEAAEGRGAGGDAAVAAQRRGGEGAGGGSMKRYAARYIKPNDRLTSFERLEIYNRQYWWRVLASMTEDFPGLRAVLGERRFEDMCRAYLTACPSQSFTLRNLGARLE